MAGPHRDAAPDPAAEIGARFMAVLAALYRNEAAQDAAPPSQEIRLKEENDHLSDMLDAIEAMAGAVPATTAAGAIHHVLLVAGLVARVMSYVQPQHVETCACLQRRIERCLYSILGVLAETPGVAPPALACDYYLPAEGNPYAGLRP